MQIDTLLQAVKDGKMDIQEAKELLARAPYEELGFAKLDSHRAVRTGFAEVVYCENKADDFLVEIFSRLFSDNGEVMGTRCSEKQYRLLKKRLPELTYDPISRIAKIGKPKKRAGLIAVCTAGTADIAVAEECAQTAEFFGQNVERFYDIGVSGIHRLLSKVDRLQKANCVVAVAGMEGALASVIGGLVANPVIAVPTSVGYGANFHGLSALLTMINSCSNGVATVNIDNGFGAGFLASQINRLATRKE
ncbi:putative uncharacterized protein [Sutterella sp. CAG:521]|nr:putative uncharacterized protein [Sutterella sp. CAG:521]